MSLRYPDHQIAIELGHTDTEFVNELKHERDQLQQELTDLQHIHKRHRTLITVSRIDVIKQRLARIEELLRK